jgi:predicted outer membrane protein
MDPRVGIGRKCSGRLWRARPNPACGVEIRQYPGLSSLLSSEDHSRRRPMDRRFVLASLATAIAAPALAQTGGSPPARQPGGAGRAGDVPAASGSGANRPDRQEMTQADRQHMQQTLQLGMVALETSRIAQQKAQNPDLKRFATFEVQEQTTLSEVLHSMMEPATTSATGSAAQPGAASGSGAPALEMDAQSREMIQRLQNTQAGEAFDRQYLQGQMEGHSALLQVQTQYLQGNPPNREHANVAKLARSQIIEHVALLEDIQTRMR